MCSSPHLTNFLLSTNIADEGVQSTGEGSRDLNLLHAGNSVGNALQLVEHLSCMVMDTITRLLSSLFMC